MFALLASAALAVAANAAAVSASTAQKYLDLSGTRAARPRRQWLDDIRPLLCRAEGAGRGGMTSRSASVRAGCGSIRLANEARYRETGLIPATRPVYRLSIRVARGV